MSGVKPIKLGHIGKTDGQGSRVYSTEGKSVCLSANGGGGGAKTGLYETDGIRKLDPIECERLQGLPDNYTEGISNTQRYKCLGNAFNVDVICHILSFIK
jgi:DNA (cytosine-5)-methyltransferase 3A